MLTEADVTDAYLSILRRTPESAAVVAQYARLNSTEALHHALRASPEYEALVAPRVGRALTLADLDDFVAGADAARGVSADAFRAFLDGAWFDLPHPPGSSDSPEYRVAVLDTYAAIAGRRYEEANEATEFDPAAAASCPYPYDTQSASEVASQLIGIGSMIRAADLSPSASVFELGIGWGNTAFHLARMGHPVTGLDMEAKWAPVLAAQADPFGLPISFRVGSFYDIETMSEKFDAVLFYEAFHHAHDHLRLLRAIPNVLKPGGKLILAGEPVDEKLPYPWGVNVSGIAVYSIRKWGWLELCFRGDYLLRVLPEMGWSVTRHDCPMTAAGLTFVCTR